jgi:hypothetical protein
MHLRLGRRMVVVGVGLCDDPKGRVDHVGGPSGGVRRSMGNEDGLLRSRRGEVRWARQGSRREEANRGVRMVELDPEILHGDGSDGQEGHGHERIYLDPQIHEGRPIDGDRRNPGRQHLQSRCRKEAVVDEHQSARNQKLAGRHQLQCDQLHP